MRAVAGRGPAVLAWAGFATACALATQGSGTFVLDRGAVQRGELWRLLTGQMVHGNLLHLALNVGAALILILLARPTAWLVVSSLAVGSFVLVLRPELASYCGLSGALHAHAGESLGRLLREHGSQRIAAVGLGVLIAKVGAELLLPAAAISSGLDFGVVPVPEAHLVGAIVGVAIGASLGVRVSKRVSNRWLA